MWEHCLVQVNRSTLLLIGGTGTADVSASSAETFFYNFETKVWSNGPQMSEKRSRKVDTISMTRLSKISPFCQKLTSFWQIFDSLFLIWQNAEPTLANLWHYWANIHCCIWPNIEKYSNRLVTLVTVVSNHEQCDQIRLFMKGMFDKITYKVAQISTVFVGYLKKCHNLCKNCCGYILGHFCKNGLFFYYVRSHWSRAFFAFDRSTKQNDYWVVVVVKWSACSLSSLIIRAQIPLILCRIEQSIEGDNANKIIVSACS